MYKITLLERVILTSLSKSPKDSDRLYFDTGIQKSLIKRITTDLIVANVLIVMDGKFNLNPQLNTQQLLDLNDANFLEREKLQLCKVMLKDQLHIKRYALGPRDLKIFNGMMTNLREFLNNTSDTRSKTKDDQMVILGNCSYEGILNTVLS